MEPKLYSTEEAARYLGKSVSAMKYHIHIRRTLKGRLIGKTLVFTQAELDEFKANLRRQGRPRNKSHRPHQALRGERRDRSPLQHPCR